mmetsp:Transcript_6987/g.11786  ORF Transcript_6987/g.11786 Transcript_6987/m.11786 type:complete len:232 (+) Transcript_6987:425-1120(+)
MSMSCSFLSSSCFCRFGATLLLLDSIPSVFLFLAFSSCISSRASFLASFATRALRAFSSSRNSSSSSTSPTKSSTVVVMAFLFLEFSFSSSFLVFFGSAFFVFDEVALAFLKNAAAVVAFPFLAFAVVEGFDAADEEVLLPKLFFFPCSSTRGVRCPNHHHIPPPFLSPDDSDALLIFDAQFWSGQNTSTIRSTIRSDAICTKNRAQLRRPPITSTCEHVALYRQSFLVSC